MQILMLEKNIQDVMVVYKFILEIDEILFQKDQAIATLKLTWWSQQINNIEEEQHNYFLLKDLNILSTKYNIELEILLEIINFYQMIIDEEGDIKYNYARIKAIMYRLIMKISGDLNDIEENNILIKDIAYLKASYEIKYIKKIDSELKIADKFDLHNMKQQILSSLYCKIIKKFLLSEIMLIEYCDKNKEKNFSFNKPNIFIMMRFIHLNWLQKIS